MPEITGPEVLRRPIEFVPAHIPEIEPVDFRRAIDHLLAKIRIAMMLENELPVLLGMHPEYGLRGEVFANGLRCIKDAEQYRAQHGKDVDHNSHAATNPIPATGGFSVHPEQDARFGEGVLDRQEGFMRSQTVPGDSATFEVHLAQFGGLLFMDLFPEPLNRRNDLCKVHWIPVHTFSRVWIEDDALKMSMLNAEWLEKMIDEDSLKIAHERIDSEIILTASTDVLQKLVISFANDPEAFPEPRILFRMD